MTRPAKCTALACGDVLVGFLLTGVTMVIGFLLLWPCVFVFLWRPYRMHRTRAMLRRARAKRAEDEGRPWEEDTRSSDELPSFWRNALHLAHPLDG